jgi:hypothetical protein
LVIKGLEKEDTPYKIAKLDLSHVVVESRFEVRKLQIEELIANSLEVKKEAIFENIIFGKYVDLRSSIFKNLEFVNVQWPQERMKIILNGVTFSQISATSTTEPNSIDELLYIADSAPFSPDFYTRLEKYFIDQGQKGGADSCFLNMKIRELYEGDLSFFKKILNILLLVSAGYGRCPVLLFVWSIFFVLIGTIIFSKKKEIMVNISDKSGDIQTFSPFWFSIDLFIPFNILGEMDIWRPKEGENWAWFYARFLRIMGWIIISISIALIIGIIK